MMGSSEFSLLSSLRGEFKSEDYVLPHYKESYRLAIDRLLHDGRDAYHDFLKAERIGNFLSDDEIFFITSNAEQLPTQNTTEENNISPDDQSSSDTYWPTRSDVEMPKLELGWPDFLDENIQTKVEVFFQPPRPNCPTIKEVIRKHIQDARQVIAIVMDTFTDIDIFKEVVDACMRDVPVYVLLDHFHLRTFVAMAESLNIKLQQLRNMRVRTVKGQDYLCRSGTKFHGTLEQKFLLVDCHTAIYGSYSFTWSFEKINESMVQVITGHLVKSYDEEFRILYAKSTMQRDLTPPEGVGQPSNLLGKAIVPNFVVSQTDQLRHSLDPAYQKACEKKPVGRDRPLLREGDMFQPVNNTGIHLPDQKALFFPRESEVSANFDKRRSFGGGQNEYLSKNFTPRGSNWNISREEEGGLNAYPKDNYLQVPPMYQGHNMQHDLPASNNKSGSFEWRIETYLKNSDSQTAETADYLDQLQPFDKGSSHVPGRMRNSFALGTTIPEQMELPGHRNTPRLASNMPLHHSSMQLNLPMSNGRRRSVDEFMTTQQNAPTFEDFHYNSGFDPRNNSYASLGRGNRIMTNPDIFTESWHKRHSVADPRSNMCEQPSPMYNAFQRTPLNRSTAMINAENSYRSSLNEDQRSISHFDVKSVTHAMSPDTDMWQNSPSRTVSTAALEQKSRNLNNSSCINHKASWKIKSMLDIPEKKEDPLRDTAPSIASGESTDTLTAEDEEKTTHSWQKPHRFQFGSIKYSSENHKNSREAGNAAKNKFSKPRFATEENHHSSQRSFQKPSTAKKTAGLDRSSRSGSERLVYSRFESFCSLEQKIPQPTTQGKSKNSSKMDVELNVTRPGKPHHENKLEKLFQRMGNFINKNK